MEQVVHTVLCLLACFIIGSSSTPAANTSQVEAKSSCPPGALRIKHACYVYFPGSLSWYSAEMECQNLRPDCHLISISGSNEEKFVSAYIRRRSPGTNTVWIGLYAVQKYNRLAWEWIDGSPYFSGETLWDKRSPSTSVSSSECVALYNIQQPSYSNRWIQQNCDSAYPYVCKYKV